MLRSFLGLTWLPVGHGIQKYLISQIKQKNEIQKRSGNFDLSAIGLERSVQHGNLAKGQNRGSYKVMRYLKPHNIFFFFG